MCEKISHGTRILLVEAYIKNKVDQWVTFDDLRAYFQTTHEIHVPDSYLTSPATHVATTYPQYVIKRGNRIMWESTEGRAQRLLNEEDEQIQEEVLDLLKLRQARSAHIAAASALDEQIKVAEATLAIKRGDRGIERYSAAG